MVLQAPAITTPEAYKQVVSAKLGFYPVEVINNEVISAAMDPRQGNV